ncbi:YVTN family beta-propeller repeat protein [Thiovibrio sp. JS02]
MLRNAVFQVMLACLAALLLPGCQPTLLPSRPLPDEQGELHLYVQPFPQEAQRLRFRLEAVSAVRADGNLIPLPMAFSEFTAGQVERQRFFAASPLPPGEYLGLSLQVAAAFLQGEEGEVALAVSEVPQRVEFPFRISKGKARLLLLKFDYSRAVGVGGVGFFPGFSIFLPERLVPKVLGYVANEKSNTITVFDKNLLQVVGVIATGMGPKDLALDRSRRRLYAPLSGEDSLALIDVSGQEVIDRARLNIGDEPCGSALSPDGNLLVTTNFGSDTVTLAEAGSLLERDRIAVGDGPCGVLVDRTGRRGYVFNLWSGTVSVLDLANRQVAATIPVGPEPIAGAFSRTGDRLFVIHAKAPHLEVIDTVSLAVRERAFVGSGMGGVVLDPRTDLLYIAKKNEGRVEIYDPLALFPLDSIRVGEEVADLAIDEEEGHLFVVLPGSGRIAVFDLLGRKMVALIEVGKGPGNVTLMGDR